MQKTAGEDEAPRFYHIVLQEDLLEGWSVVREWGFQGSPGRVARKHYPDRDQAQEAALEYRDQQVKRGFRVVFMQGSSV